MGDPDDDTLMRMAAFEHVRRLSEVHDHLTATELKPGFVFSGERIPLVTPQRGVDYSGAQTPSASLKGLRVYLTEGEALAPVAQELKVVE